MRDVREGIAEYVYLRPRAREMAFHKKQKKLATY